MLAIANPWVDCQEGSDEGDIFRYFVDILTVANLGGERCSRIWPKTFLAKGHNIGTLDY
jgi:hypothetical protein